MQGPIADRLAGYGLALRRLGPADAEALGESIDHDKANLASGAVPCKLGFRLIGEAADPKLAPAEVGIDCAWRIERDGWRVDP